MIYLKEKVLLFFIFIFIFGSCKKDKGLKPMPFEPNVEEFIPEYSFFVAGHTYGHPENFQYGFHPPFLDKIPFLNDYPLMKLGVLTGDVVPLPNQAYWDAALLDIAKFSIPIHVAAGNHDRGPVFDNIFKEPYYSFKTNNDLFIVLLPTNWNIEGDQKEFLMETIESNYLAVNNVFIFLHELIWWSPDNIFGNIEINYRPQYPGSTNYWAEINPFLESIPNNVVLFAGDLGANSLASPYMYYKDKNVTLIGSGMGNGERDNMIVVEIGQNGEIKYSLYGINADTPFILANLEEYELP